MRSRRKPRRENKSPQNLEMMRRAGLLVWETLHRVVAPMIRPGVTTREIDAAVERTFREHHAQSLFKNYVPEGANVPPFPAVTCISINEEVVHGIPGPRQLAEGDIVSIDTGCKLDGWCGDAAYTYPVGEVHPEVRRLLEVTQGVLDLAIGLMATASRWSQVAAEMEKYVKDHGFYVVEAFVGHGIGREMHEDPQVPNFVSDQLKKSGDFA
ncbi:MAG: type I methionyl aminopeptidase, partial [Thermoguttaceae bacterium]|nr:type I methionyl aminopeptidase [Thermoguttaceae bacterium]